MKINAPVRRLAPVLIIVAGVLWGITGIFVRYLNRIGLTTMNVVAVRVLCLLLFCQPDVLRSGENYSELLSGMSGVLPEPELSV